MFGEILTERGEHPLKSAGTVIVGFGETDTEYEETTGQVLQALRVAVYP
jgi:hypothetical protein